MKYDIELELACPNPDFDALADEVYLSTLGDATLYQTKGRVFLLLTREAHNEEALRSLLTLDIVATRFKVKRLLIEEAS